MKTWAAGFCWGSWDERRVLAENKGSLSKLYGFIQPFRNGTLQDSAHYAASSRGAKAQAERKLAYRPMVDTPLQGMIGYVSPLRQINGGSDRSLSMLR